MAKAQTPGEDPVATLERHFGRGSGPLTCATAPGRCTLVGEHVDYADGLVLCCAINLSVSAAVRPSPAGRWRAVSRHRTVERGEPLARAGDIGDRLFAAAVAAGDATGVTTPPLDIAVEASLPESAGLSSSAAVVVATMVAVLRLQGRRLSAAALIHAALRAERDLVGVPCGPLDHRAVVRSPAQGALLLDCRSGVDRPVPWHLRGAGLVACATGETHDVGGAGYRQRRQEADEAQRRLGVASYRDAVEAGLARLPPPLAQRARHILRETARAGAAAAALERGDAVRLGHLMTESHESLRDDYAVSTPALDDVVAAAMSVPGCLGARMVGAGFGGTVIALARDDAAESTGRAMENASSRTAGVWPLAPAAGMAERAPDVIEAGQR
jgi:galactokinase